MPSRKALFDAAWIEYRVTRQINSGNGEAYLACAPRPPGWFILGELGYGPGEHPTLEETLAGLEQRNRRTAEAMAERAELVHRLVPRKKVSAKVAQSALRRRLAHAGVRVVAGQLVRA